MMHLNQIATLNDGKLEYIFYLIALIEVFKTNEEILNAKINKTLNIHEKNTKFYPKKRDPDERTKQNKIVVNIK